MNLDQTTIVIRPRTAWEAMDLGFLLAVKWFGRLWRLWLVTGLATGGPGLLISLKYPRLGLLIIWWLKSLHEPLLLYWLSRAVFGECLPCSTVAVKWRQLVLPNLLHSLGWYRFFPERSFFLPVHLLEGGDKASQKKRNQVLGKNQSGALWLTGFCFAVEIIICFSLILLAFLFIPESVRLAVDYQAPFAFPVFYVACYLAAVSIVTPFYVAGGFMLYLSRRVELEAWDIEIGFKKMAEKALKRRGNDDS
ncbi:MAG: hypothetical protein DSY90_05035 [Deltaproteobacteria bacterium]|nr:MAG: hypothetical protein DSY90_05035 [Deltaproteobacteria bacterium]